MVTMADVHPLQAVIFTNTMHAIIISIPSVLLLNHLSSSEPKNIGFLRECRKVSGVVKEAARSVWGGGGGVAQLKGHHWHFKVKLLLYHLLLPLYCKANPLDPPTPDLAGARAKVNDSRQSLVLDCALIIRNAWLTTKAFISGYLAP